MTPAPIASLLAVMARGDNEETERLLRPALEAHPDSPPLRLIEAELARRRGNYPVALGLLKRLLQAHPQEVNALRDLGQLHAELGQFCESLTYYNRALELDPARADIACERLFALDYVADLTEEQFHGCRRDWAQRYASRSPLAHKPRPPHRPLRVGYLSGEFRNCAVGFACAPVVLHHDKTRVSTYLYADQSQEDALTQRFRNAATAWRNIHGLDVVAAVRLILEDDLDLLVDLTSTMSARRLLLLSHRPARLQATAWGHPHSTGLGTIDYLIADPFVVPASSRAAFVERVVDLPCLLGYEPPAHLPSVERRFDQAHGTAFTWGSTNHFNKISPPCIALWSQLLHATPGSRLLIKTTVLDNAHLQRQLLRSFAQHGIPATRLTLRGTTSHEDHLATYQEIDLLLDTFPRVGGMTTLESLAMGVPVLSLSGNLIPQRISASVLNAVGLSEWITTNTDDYRQLALERAAHPERLRANRAHVRAALFNSDIGDPQRYVQHVEDLYEKLTRKPSG